MFLLKTMHHVCFNKQGLRVAKQRFHIIQIEAHSGKERHPSSSNKASVWTKQGLCVCLKSLLLIFKQCCLNPANMHIKDQQCLKRCINITKKTYPLCQTTLVLSTFFIIKIKIINQVFFSPPAGTPLSLLSVIEDPPLSPFCLYFEWTLP